MAPKTRSQTAPEWPQKTRSGFRSSGPIHYSYHSDYPDVMHAYFMKYGRHMNTSYIQPAPTRTYSYTSIAPTAPRRSSHPSNMPRARHYSVQHQDPLVVKKTILSNAWALFGKDYKNAELDHFDVITSSNTPTGRLDSQECRASLIVYTHTKHRNGATYRDWELLYKSNVCATREDALFELLYWVEDDVHRRVSGMRAEHRRPQSAFARAGQNGTEKVTDGAGINVGTSKVNANEQAATTTANNATDKTPIPPSSPLTIVGDDHADLSPPAKVGRKRSATEFASDREEKRVRFAIDEGPSTGQDKTGNKFVANEADKENQTPTPASALSIPSHGVTGGPTGTEVATTNAPIPMTPSNDSSANGTAPAARPASAGATSGKTEGKGAPISSWSWN